MATSFLSQIPTIVYLISQLKPKSILDIGKGFGKYGFLIHEYIGIDNSKRLNPKLSLKEQSQLSIDAVEIDEQLFLPHLNQIYNRVYEGNILNLYQDLPHYDLILMIDVIEHIEKKSAIKMLEHLSAQKSNMIIATPEKYFEQHLYDSPFEEHVSFWHLNDFKNICFVDYQKIDGGVVYCLSLQKINIRGFGSALIKRIRRILRCIRNEIF